MIDYSTGKKHDVIEPTGEVDRIAGEIEKE